MKIIKKPCDLISGEWYWRDRKIPVKVVKQGRWYYFVGGNWIQPYVAGSVLKSHEICGPIPKPRL